MAHPPDNVLRDSMKVVDRLYKKLGGDDNVSKGTEFTTKLREEIIKNLEKSSKK